MWFLFVLVHTLGLLATQRLLRPTRPAVISTLYGCSGVSAWAPSLADEDAWIASGGDLTFDEWCNEMRCQPPAVYTGCQLFGGE